MLKPMKESIENIQTAFRVNGSSMYEQCACGKIYYDNYNQWDWEADEFEDMEANPNAIARGYAIERIELQSTYYCLDCDCWHELAERIIGFLMTNRAGIAEFYRLEKRRLEKKAGTIPLIDPKPVLSGGRKMILTD